MHNRLDGKPIPTNMGDEKGAFTWAMKEYIGSFEQANSGSIVLDKISTIAELVQISLLRLPESRKYLRIVGWKTINANVGPITTAPRFPSPSIPHWKRPSGNWSLKG